jgi:hypothetical protein
VTHLRKAMEELQRRNLSPITTRIYLRAVEEYAGDLCSWWSVSRLFRSSSVLHRQLTWPENAGSDFTAGPLTLPPAVATSAHAVAIFEPTHSLTIHSCGFRSELYALP